MANDRTVRRERSKSKGSRFSGRRRIWLRSFSISALLIKLVKSCITMHTTLALNRF